MTESKKLSQISWQIEKTHPYLVDSLKENLRQVMDPETGLNIIELGLIRDVRVESEEVQVEMILTTPFCPYAPALLEMARKKAEEVIGKPTMIEMGLTLWTPAMMEEGTGAEWGLF